MSTQYVDQTTIRRLIAAILLQAISDYRALQSGQVTECNEFNMKELNKFFSSDWFDELCEMCDIDKKTILRNLIGEKQ